ncbi:MAG: 1,4-dihydroxy-2-naphthoate polyprenyltransferase [Clostridiaceae bacterium]|nr:1,4-dihydroxy-2-naphthoate polyprenyltransferase [Clostridiaceae bacterium]
MFIKSFLKLVEIQTKVASMIPFIIGTTYVLYRFDSFNVKNFLLFFISLLSIDMATTAINNYCDYKKANKTYGYNYEKHNAIVRYNLSERKVICIIFVLLSIAVIFGFLLFFNTNLLVLVLGVMSFAVGIFYTFGPVPISRMPLGELFSGFFMGFVIMFLSIYIHVYDQSIAALAYDNGAVNIYINLFEVLKLFLVSIPAVIGIANIMLANNICDIEDDIENKRYTLPIYIGKKNSLILFRISYYVMYLILVLSMILKIVPITAVLVLPTIISVNKNIKKFFEIQTKKDTFVLAVKNFVMINLVYILSISLAIISDKGKYFLY